MTIPPYSMEEIRRQGLTGGRIEATVNALDALAEALEGLELRHEPGVFCDHAAAPCHRCDAAAAALKKAGRR